MLCGSPFMFTFVCRALARMGEAATALALTRERYEPMLADGSERGLGVHHFCP
jgi:hypothetical protein